MKWKYVRIFLMGLLYLVSNEELYSQYCLKMSYDKNGNRISTVLNECVEIFRESSDDAIEKDTREVLVYPNPNNGKFKVELNNVTDGFAELYVYDNKGAMINNNVFIGMADVDISNYPAGAYLLRILSNDNEKSVIVIKH